MHTMILKQRSAIQHEQMVKKLEALAALYGIEAEIENLRTTQYAQRNTDVLRLKQMEATNRILDAMLARYGLDPDGNPVVTDEPSADAESAESGDESLDTAELTAKSKRGRKSADG